MEYLTASEIAEKWNISRKRGSLLWTRNCIEGASLKGNVWLIPENAEKMGNPRWVRKMGQVGE